MTRYEEILVTPPPHTSGRSVVQHRAEEGISQLALATILSVSQAAVSGWERYPYAGVPGPAALLIALWRQRGLSHITYDRPHSEVRALLTAERIRRIRSDLGLTRMGFATLLGLSCSRTVLAWEGSNPEERPSSLVARLIYLASCHGAEHILLLPVSPASLSAPATNQGEARAPAE